jgi:hypothetical protein
MIDDFDHGESWNFPAGASDGRVGTWEHRGFDASAYPGASVNKLYTLYCGETSDESCGDSGMGGSAGEITPGSLVFKCEASDDWCNTPWDSSRAYGQYANLEVSFVPYNAAADGLVDCYNALEGGFTGIKFDIRSSTATSVLPQLSDPTKPIGTDPLNFRGPKVDTTAEFKTVEIPFADFKTPDWASIDVSQRGLAVDAASLRSLALIVNPKPESGDGVMGESVQPYNIEIDNVSFY